MALSQLVSVGNQNTHIPRNESFEFTSIPITMNYNNSIMRNSDKIKLKHIAIKTNNNFTEEQFKDFVKDFTIELQIGVSNMISLNMDFVCNLNPILKVDDTFCITLPFDYLLNEIYLVALGYHAVIFKLSGRQNDFTIELFAENIFLDNEARNQLATNSQEQTIQQIYKLGDYEGTMNNVRIMLNGNHLTKGFFIKGNIDEIMQMEFCLNGNTRFKFTKPMIVLYTHKISNNMFYLSLNGINNYNNLSNESFVGSLNLGRIDIAMMSFTFRNNNNVDNKKIEIYGISFNLLRYLNGMSGIAYVSENNFEITNTRQTFPLPTTNTTQIFSLPTSNTTQTLPITFTTTVRPIEPDKTTCAITYEEIGEFYCKCLGCDNNFDFDALNQWLVSRSVRNRTCPLCRVNWSNFVKYSKNEIIV